MRTIKTMQVEILYRNGRIQILLNINNMESIVGTSCGTFNGKVGGITPSVLVFLFLFASSVKAQDGNEVHPFTQHVNLVRSPNLAVGASSLYAGKYIFDRLCPSCNTGHLYVRQECIIGLAAGLIFSIYGFYRIGGLLRSQSRSIDLDYQDNTLLRNFLGKSKVLLSLRGDRMGLNAFILLLLLFKIVIVLRTHS
ncbi:hypothetical protein WALSEDRAFT_60463 [Wallemia mellicola CBS 633.66]|uniref:Uncharacterized protein n=1 Tax=Wallemia mellicola (strain ATCC MYA-4683 / CBS 633.66) TaxID=671144 RepID=I4YBZ8_WALMC|nr:hypothetical protein WALSEDRAFT_60463 [Wallemia mellicola CBS 633.66]EIM21490.1 hypothetical protein WALSEDRAFT_60463 [Wallemia mellicola CBS 633.66]|eukprot:XP_006958519.1 hypothetical protein WALSEDRAFT_60463 [Wallemia mellicola CBS 633.66]